MYLTTSIILLGLAYGLKYALKYRDWLALSRNVIFRTAPGPCTTVIEEGGSEDIVNIDNTFVLISSGLNPASKVGTIKAMDLTTNQVWVMNITNAPSRSNFMAAPHGMSTWKDPKTDEVLVYVLTHPAKEDKIEVFLVRDRFTIQYIKTIVDPKFGANMNDLVMVGKDKFYITKFLKYRQMSYILMENILKIYNGAIMYYDGYKAREEIYMDSGVDNIDVDPITGDLWIGSHPHLYKVLDFYDLFGITKPSQVLRVKLRDQAVSEVWQPYADSGHEIEGSTVAVYTNGKLLIGSVARQMIVCDVKYLSP